MRYADDTAILATNVGILQYMFDKLVKVEKNYGMKINIQRTKAIRISGKMKKCLNIIRNQQNLVGQFN